MTLKIAVFAPIPSASVPTTSVVKAGRFTSRRTVERTRRPKLFIRLTVLNKVRTVWVPGGHAACARRASSSPNTRAF